MKFNGTELTEETIVATRRASILVMRAGMG